MWLASMISCCEISASPAPMSGRRMARRGAMTRRNSYIQAPIVFLHGTAASPRQWRDLIGHLPQALETLALDLPDYVAHEVHSVQRSLSQEAQILLPKLRGLGRPFHLVGHSY